MSRECKEDLRKQHDQSIEYDISKTSLLSCDEGEDRRTRKLDSVDFSYDTSLPFLLCLSCYSINLVRDRVDVDCIVLYFRFHHTTTLMTAREYRTVVEPSNKIVHPLEVMIRSIVLWYESTYS